MNAAAFQSRFSPLAVVLLLSAALASSDLLSAEPAAATHVLIVVGPSNHPPGSHEVAAGGKVIEYLLEQAEEVDVEAEVVSQWPLDKAVLDRTATVVFIGDTFPPLRMPDSSRIMTELATMMDRGCGIVCVHYATGLRAADVAADGEHPLLHWMGGYFATGCKHHQSKARIYPSAVISPATADHPTVRGWKPFTIHDEPYINNYFGPNGNQPAPGVTILATSPLPPEAPKPEAVAWGVRRPDGGRGFGIVMPHFFRSWKNDDLRTFILNGIVWTAKLEVPAAGIQVKLPDDLGRFGPASIEPQPRK